MPNAADPVELAWPALGARSGVIRESPGQTLQALLQTLQAVAAVEEAADGIRLESWLGWLRAEELLEADLLLLFKLK